MSSTVFQRGAPIHVRYAPIWVLRESLFRHINILLLYILFQPLAKELSGSRGARSFHGVPSTRSCATTGNCRHERIDKLQLTPKCFLERHLQHAPRHFDIHPHSLLAPIHDSTDRHQKQRFCFCPLLRQSPLTARRENTDVASGDMQDHSDTP